ncbi:MAG: type II secretory protein PulD [Acidobacteriaceae bacterium]
MQRLPHRRLLPRTLRVAGPAAFAFLGMIAPEARAQDAPPSTQTQTTAIRPAISARQSRAADDAYLAGARQLAHNDPVAAERSFARALELDPGKPEYALSLAIATEHHVSALVQQATKTRLLGNAAEADRLFAEAQALDPDNVIVTQHLNESALRGLSAAPGPTASDEIAKLGGPIHVQPSAGTHSFHSRGDAQNVLREIYNAFAIKTTFDPSIVSQNVRFDLDDADFATATRVLLGMTHTFATTLDEKSVLLAKDTQENRDRLVPLVEETFYLPGLPVEQLNELSNVAKNIFDLKQVTVQASGDRIVMRGNEEAMKLVNATFADLLDGGAEIVLQVHIYELDKTHTRNIGAQLPASAGAFSIAAEAQQLVSANQSLIQQAIAAGFLVLSGSPLNMLEQELGFLVASGTVNVAQVTNLLGIFGGGLTLGGLFLGSGSSFNLLLSSSDVRLLDDVQMRVSDNQTGIFRIGTRYPIVTATFSSSVSSSLASALSGVKIGGTSAAALLAQFAGGSTATTPQVQFEDLGLTLKATPQALKSGQVHVRLDLKIEALGASSLNGIPVLNNRQLTSDITVPLGGTALLASEVSGLEQHSIEGLPGLSEIPGFQGTDRIVEKDTGELLITITPRIVRKRSSMVASRRLVANISPPEQ